VSHLLKAAVESPAGQGFIQEGFRVMTRICRISRLGQALAVGSACCLAGCQQVPTNSAQTANSSLLNTSAADGPMTAAQQANMQVAMGRVTESQGDLAGAMAAYSEALKRNGKSAEAYVRMAIVHDKQGEFRESAEMYRKALKLSPGNPDIYCDMGYSLYLQRRWAEAEMNTRQALALDAKHLRAHNNLALLLARDGRLDDALAEFHKGGSDRAAAHANLAFVLTMEQRFADARKQYQLALAADPSLKEVEARLRQLDTLVAKLEPGQDDLRRTHDARLVATSSTTWKKNGERRTENGTKPSISQPEATSSVASIAVGTPTVTSTGSGGQPVATIPRPMTFEGPKTAPPQRLIPQPEATSSATLVAVATPRATPTDTARQPGATILQPTTFDSPKTAPGGTGRPPRAPIPLPREFQALKPVQPDGNRAASSKSVIPPPRRRVPPPPLPRTNVPADMTALAPIPISVPKADTAANRPQAVEGSPILSLESAQ